MMPSYQTRIVLSAIAVTLAVLAVSAAIWFPKVKRTVDVMDILFVIDITQSMDVIDAKRDGQTMSRMEWAKTFVHHTLTALPCGSHVGLAVFSESRSLILINPVEVCANYSELTAMLDKIKRTMAWALASEISKASYTAIKQARSMKPQPGIVFITDGHEAPPLHKTLYPKFRGKPGEIKGVFVGVGGDKLLPIPKHDLEGRDLGYWQPNEVLQHDVYHEERNDLVDMQHKPKNEHLSSQKKSYLKKLAQRVGFAYLASPESPRQLIEVLKQHINTHKQALRYDPASWFGWLALILLVVIYAPFTGKKTRI